MWVPLAVLAVLAVIGGFVGIGPAFKALTGSEHPGGRMNIVNWLDPVVWNPQTREFGKEHGAEGAGGHAQLVTEHGPLLASSDPSVPQEKAQGKAAGEEAAAPYGDTGFNLAHAAAEAFHSHTAAEWLFIIISLAVAALGIGLGWLFYVKNPRLPGVWAERLRPLYRASYNKYWVDELYGALFTRRTMDAARAVYATDAKGIDGAVNGSARLTRTLSLMTGGFDKYVVDGLVNGIANFIGGIMSNVIRAAQTGFAQNYALVMVFGLVIAVALFFARDILTAVRGIFAFFY